MKAYIVLVNGTFHGEYLATDAYFARMACANDYGCSLATFDKTHVENGVVVNVYLVQGE